MGETLAAPRIVPHDQAASSSAQRQSHLMTIKWVDARAERHASLPLNFLRLVGFARNSKPKLPSCLRCGTDVSTVMLRKKVSPSKQVVSCVNMVDTRRVGVPRTFAGCGNLTDS